MEDESKSHLFLALGIIGIILFSICIAWLIVLCERWRRRRKFRPGVTNRRPSPMSLSPIKASPLNKKGGDEWNHLVFANTGLFTPFESDCERSEMLDKRHLSLPNILSTSVAESLSVEDEEYLSIQIAAILGSFPNLKYMEESEEDLNRSRQSVEVVVENYDEDEGPETEVDDSVTLDLVPKPSCMDGEDERDSRSPTDEYLLLETTL